VPTTQRKRRVPQLKFTELRGIGWHVSYRDRETNRPRKHRFQVETKAEAEKAYHAWVAAFLGDDAEAMAAASSGKPPTPMVEPVEALAGGKRARSKPKAAKVEAQPGSLLHVASGLIRYEESRVRDEGGGRVPGTITYRECLNKKKAIHDFLGYLNERNGRGAVARMHLADLTMQDVEAYNRQMVEQGFTVNTLRRKMQIIKRIIDRAGRPEYGQQVLTWNWDSLDRTPGRASKRKKLPTLEQVQKLLAAADTRGKAIIWMGIGLGFGQSDLSTIRVDDIDQTGYDLRRGKTGIDRYGDTPSGVWRAIEDYLAETPRQAGEPLFVTKNGQRLVHTKSDSILQWWNRLRESIGETKETLDGFYVLRHLGATEFGSRDGCSISAMKRWLGHSASSSMADVYMRPVSPEHRATIEWVRNCLITADK